MTSSWADRLRDRSVPGGDGDGPFDSETVEDRQELPALTKDLVFDLLSSPRRRYVLYHLSRSDGPVEIGGLAEAVAAWENDVPIDELTRQQRKRVYVSLYQTHVPKLADAGVVRYDEEEGIVGRSRRTDEIGRFLVEEDRWSLVSPGLAVAGAAFTIGAALDVGPLADVPDMTALVVVALVFLLAAVADRVRRRRARSRALARLVRNGR